MFDSHYSTDPTERMDHIMSGSRSDVVRDGEKTGKRGHEGDDKVHPLEKRRFTDLLRQNKKKKTESRTSSFSDYFSGSGPSTFHHKEKPVDSHVEDATSGDKGFSRKNTQGVRKVSGEDHAVTFESYIHKFFDHQRILYLTFNQIKKLVPDLGKVSDKYQIDKREETKAEYRNINLLSNLHVKDLLSRFKPLSGYKQFTEIQRLLKDKDRHTGEILLRKFREDLREKTPKPHTMDVDGTIHVNALKLDGSTQKADSSIEYIREVNIESITELKNKERYFPLKKDAGKAVETDPSKTVEADPSIPIYTYNIANKDTKKEAYVKEQAKLATGIDGVKNYLKTAKEVGEATYAVEIAYSKKYAEAEKAYVKAEKEAIKELDSDLKGTYNDPITGEKVDHPLIAFSKMRGEDTKLTKCILKAREASAKEISTEEELISSQQKLMEAKDSSKAESELNTLRDAIVTDRTKYENAALNADTAWEAVATEMGSVDKEQAKKDHLLKDRVHTHTDHQSIELYTHNDRAVLTGVRVKVDDINFAASGMDPNSVKRVYDLHLKNGEIFHAGWAQDISETIRTRAEELYNEYLNLCQKRITDLISLIEEAPSRANDEAINKAITTIEQQDLVQQNLTHDIVSRAAFKLDEEMVPAMREIQKLRRKTYHEIIEMNSKGLSGQLSKLNVTRKELTSALLEIGKAHPRAREIIARNDSLMHPFGEESNFTTRRNLKYELAGRYLTKRVGISSALDHLSHLLKGTSADVRGNMIQHSINEAYFAHEHPSSAHQGKGPDARQSAVSNAMRKYDMEEPVADAIAGTVVREMDASFTRWFGSKITITERDSHTGTISRSNITIQSYLHDNNVLEAEARKMFRSAAQEYLRLPQTIAGNPGRHFNLGNENRTIHVDQKIQIIKRMQESINISRSTILKEDISISERSRYNRKSRKVSYGTIGDLLRGQTWTNDVIELKAREILRNAARPNAHIRSMRPQINRDGYIAYADASGDTSHSALYDTIHSYGVGDKLADKIATMVGREIEASKTAFWDVGQVVTAKEYMTIKGIDSAEKIKTIFGDVPKYPNAQDWLDSTITVNGERTTVRRHLKSQRVEEPEARSLFLLRSTVDDDAYTDKWWDNKIPSSTDKSKLQVMRKRYLGFIGVDLEAAQELHKSIPRKNLLKWSSERVPFNGGKRKDYLSINDLSERLAEKIYSLTSRSDKIVNERVSAKGIVRKASLEGNDISEVVATKIHSTAHQLNPYGGGTIDINLDGWSKTEIFNDKGESLGTIGKYLGDRDYSPEAIQSLFTSIKQEKDFKTWFEGKVGEEIEEETVSKGTKLIKRGEELKDNGILADGAAIIYNTVPKLDKKTPKPSEEAPKPGEEAPKPGEEAPKPGEEAPKPGEEAPKLDLAGWLKTKMLNAEGESLGTVEKYLSDRNYSPEAMQSLFTSIEQSTDFKTWFEGEVSKDLGEETIRKVVYRDTGETVNRMTQLKALGLSKKERTDFIKSIHQAKNKAEWLEKDIVVGGKTVKVKNFLEQRGLSDDLYDDMPPSNLEDWKKTLVTDSEGTTTTTLEKFLEDTGFTKEEIPSLFTSIEQSKDFKTWYEGNLPGSERVEIGADTEIELRTETISRENALVKMGFTKAEIPQLFESINQAKSRTEWFEKDIVVGGKTVKVHAFFTATKEISPYDLYHSIPKPTRTDWEGKTIILGGKPTTIKVYLNGNFSFERQRQDVFESMVQEPDYTKWSDAVIDVYDANPLTINRADHFEARGMNQAMRDAFFKKGVRAHAENFYAFSIGSEELSVGTNRIKEIFSPTPPTSTEGGAPAPKIDPTEGAALAADLRKQLLLAGQGTWNATDVINRYINNRYDASRIAESLALKPGEELSLHDTERWLTTEPGSIHRHVGELNQLWKNRSILDVIHHKMLINIPMEDLKGYLDRLETIDESAVEKLHTIPSDASKKVPGQFYIEEKEKELIKAEVLFQNQWVKNIQNAHSKFIIDPHGMKEELHTVINHINGQLAKVDGDRIQAMGIVKDDSKTSAQKTEMLNRINPDMGEALRTREMDVKEFDDRIAVCYKDLEKIGESHVFDKGKEKGMSIGEKILLANKSLESLGRYTYESALMDAIDSGDRQRAEELIAGKNGFIKDFTEKGSKLFAEEMERNFQTEKIKFVAKKAKEQLLWFIVGFAFVNANQSFMMAQQSFDRLNVRLFATGIGGK